MKQEILVDRLGSKIPRELTEDRILLSAIPLQDVYGEGSVFVLFVECMLAYDLNIGCSYTLLNNNRPVANAFVFDKYDSTDGAPHLHLLSVHPSNQSKGYGSNLLSNILLIEKNDGLTVECKSSSFQFFEASGFKLGDAKFNKNDHLCMFTDKAEKKPNFKRPKYDESSGDTYGDAYEACLDRLIRKGLIIL